jgi:hypothetical protein
MAAAAARRGIYGVAALLSLNFLSFLGISFSYFLIFLFLGMPL